MSLHSFTISEEAATYASTAAQDEHETADERRATTRADAAWQDARGIADHPALTNLDIGGDVKDWHDRFLIRSDHHMPHAVFIACGTGLQSSWQMKRLGGTLEAILPHELCGRFSEGCSKSLATGSPVPVDGSYRDDQRREVLFRSIMMPVRAMNDDVDFIYGAYSHKVVN